MWSARDPPALAPGSDRQTGEGHEPRGGLDQREGPGPDVGVQVRRGEELGEEEEGEAGSHPPRGASKGAWHAIAPLNIYLYPTPLEV